MCRKWLQLLAMAALAAALASQAPAAFGSLDLASPPEAGGTEANEVADESAAPHEPTQRNDNAEEWGGLGLENAPECEESARKTASGILFFYLFIHCKGAPIEGIIPEEASGEWEVFRDGMRRFYGEMKIGKGDTLKIILNSRLNGAGEIHIGNQVFYLIDGHSDGATYEQGFLTLEMVDLNEDGFKDLIFSGSVNYSGEIDGEIYERESVVYIYFYNFSLKKFDLKYRHSTFDIEISNDASNQWWERYYGKSEYKRFRELDANKDRETSEL